MLSATGRRGFWRARACWNIVTKRWQFIAEDSVVGEIDVFIDVLDLAGLGFKVIPSHTGRPAYHASTMLKMYVFGYLNRIPSSRRLEREARRNVELMWLAGRLAPNFKTIADFRRHHGNAIRLVRPRVCHAMP